MIDGIIAAVSIPVMAKCRIGHFVEAQVLQAIGVDYIDESEVLTPADEAHHVDKWEFTVPFVCGATNLGEALRRIAEGAAMIRSKGEAGTGNVVEATRHMRSIRAEIRTLAALSAEELYTAAKELQAPYELVAEVAAAGKLPVVLFTAGGIATPADAAMMMQLGAEGVFVGSGIFKSGDPAARAAAIVKATTFYDDPDVIAKVSRGLGEADGRHQPGHPAAGAALRRPRLVMSPVIGVLALQGDVAEHLRARDRDRRDGRRGAPPRRAGRGRRPDHPGRGVHHDLEAGRHLRADGAAAQADRRRPAGVRLLRRDDHAGRPAAGPGRAARRRSAAIDMTVRRNAFGRQVDSFECDIDLEGVRRGRRSARCSSAPRGSSRSGPASRFWPPSRARVGSSPSARVPRSPRRSTRSSPGTGAIHEIFTDMVRERA